MFTTDSKTFLKAIKTTMSAIEKSQLPILSHINICGNGDVTLQATNLTMFISTKINTQPQETFQICVPTKKLLKIIETCEDDITCFVQEDKFIIQNKTTETSLPTLSSEDFPISWHDKDTQPPISITIPTQTFLTDCMGIPEIASTKKLKGLDAIYFDGKKGDIVATDEVTLVKNSVTWIPKNVTALIPVQEFKKALSIIEKHKKEFPEITFEFTDKNISISLGLIKIDISLSQETFPDYEKVIPNKEEYSLITIEREKLVAALKLCNPIKDDKIFAVNFWMIPNQNKLFLYCENRSEQCVTIQCKAKYSQNPMEQDYVAIDLERIKKILSRQKKLFVDLWIHPQKHAPSIIDNVIIMPMTKKQYTTVPSEVAKCK